MSSVRNKILDIEDEIENFIPDNKRAELKIRLDRLMPAALILLGSLITFHFFVPVSNQISKAINLLNIFLILFFIARLGLAFSLAKSHKKFLRQHWFDALLVLPALGLITELRMLMLFESEVEERAIIGFLFARSTMIAGRVTRIYTWIRRIIRL